MRTQPHAQPLWALQVVKHRTQKPRMTVAQCLQRLPQRMATLVPGDNREAAACRWTIVTTHIEPRPVLLAPGVDL